MIVFYFIFYNQKIYLLFVQDIIKTDIPLFYDMPVTLMTMSKNCLVQIKTGAFFILLVQS